LRLAVNGKEFRAAKSVSGAKVTSRSKAKAARLIGATLRIKELPPSGATPEQTAPVAEPMVSLYDGRSLRGWREAAGWKPPIGRLRGEAARDALVERSLAISICRLDWSRDAAQVRSARCLRAGDAREIALARARRNSCEGWNRLA
jgi:hypothetical protein